jgi:hypothetical protein
MPATNNTTQANARDSQAAVNRNFNCNVEDFFFPILDMSSYDSGADTSYIQMHSLNYDHVDPLHSDNYRSQITELNNITNNVYIKKTYLKAGIEEELIYDDPENVFCGFGFPRAILTIQKAIPINASTYLGTGDSKSPYNKVSAVSAAEDFSILAYSNNGNVTTEIHDALVQLFSHYYGLWLKNGTLPFIGTGGTPNPVKGPAQPASTTQVTPDGGNLTPEASTFGSFADLRKSPFNKEMSPKAAMAGFAGVPVESQQFVYGPWVNYPDLQRHKIFPHLNNSQRMSAIENMIGASEVTVQLDFVPENYGGMYLLDQVASEMIESETSYQQRFETGSLSIPGLPLFALGDELSKYGSSIGYYVALDQQNIGYGVMRRKATVNTGPNITSISVQLNKSPETRYTFKTYSSKLNVFNKKNADNMLKVSERQQKARRDFFTQLNIVEQKLSKKLNMYSSFRDKLAFNVNGERSDTSSASPVEILVGNVYDYAARITGSTTGVYTTKRSNVGLFDSKEVPREMTSSYSLKSFMSLDGFYSPVSFFPTKWGHTVPYTKFEKNNCPICNGTKKYKEIRFTPNGNGAQSEVDVYCDYCEDIPFYKSSNKKLQPPRIPPFILASGLSVTVRESADGAAQNAVVYEYVADKNLIQNPKNFLKSLTGGDSSVNLITLNPIISVSGAFRNTNSNPEDFSGHSIEVVGRGYVAPQNSLRIAEDIVEGAVVGTNLTGQSAIPRLEDVSTQVLNKVVPKAFLDIDYNSYDFRKLLNNTPIAKIHELNNRFFGFKGPMVMHGWGYDIDGFPVPNASGNPIFTGQFKPHATTGALWRTRSLDVMGSNDIDNIDYGDIVVGQNMRWENGSWSEPYREKEFLNGWGLKQNNWPVGPIDLRWDEARRVWVADTNKKYDNVYVTLEEDLILEQNSRQTYPARGFLDELDFDKEPIPSGTRRVVFVKDRAGYTAPRGAKLYCAYDNNSGFYQPISKPNIICSGIIRQGLNAEIFANYAEPITGMIQDVSRINVKFTNNLNFELKPNHKAMFVYMDGVWNLMSIGRS